MNSTENASKEPEIFDYFDYREYLRAYIAFQKQRTPVFSHRYIVQKAGLKSPTALKHVMDGIRNMSLETANKFANAFKFEGNKRHYFLTLVLFTQSKNLGERERYLKDLLDLKKEINPAKLDDNKYDVFEKWYHLVVREIISLPDFKNSSKWIARVLSPQISPQEAWDSIELLKKIGLISKKGTHYSPEDPVISTEEKVKSVKVMEYHRQMIQLASDSLRRYFPDDIEISGTTLRIAQDDLLTLKKMLREFRKRLLKFAEASDKADQIYQLNFQLFPVVNKNRKGKLVDERDDL